MPSTRPNTDGARNPPTEGSTPTTAVPLTASTPRLYRCTCENGHVHGLHTVEDDDAAWATLRDAKCPRCGARPFTATECAVPADGVAAGLPRLMRVYVTRDHSHEAREAARRLREKAAALREQAAHLAERLKQSPSKGRP